MRSFRLEFLDRLPVPQRLLRTLTALGEYRGKQTLWAQTKPEVLKALRQVAVIESVESSSRMENVRVGPQTFARIMEAAGEPEAEDRSQAELAGYRDALNLIHANASDMPVSVSTVMQLHQTLMRYTAGGGGRWKAAPNDIVERGADGAIARLRLRTLAPALTPQAMDDLHDGLNRALMAGEVEPLLLVPLYAHDFLAIHPFADGNGRMARLMTVLLLHRLGYEVGRYVSLERIIEHSKETYYDSLARSDAGWAEGRHDPLPFTEYLLGVVLAAYRELEDKTAIELDYGARTRMVEQAVQSLPTEFRLADVEAKVPLVGRDTIRTALTKLRKEGRIISEGRGRYARWRRLQ
ncbi:MAG: Fic family protein [Oceanicaulis sp.]